KELFVDSPAVTDSEPLYVWTDTSSNSADSTPASPLVVSHQSADSDNQDRSLGDDGLSDPLNREPLTNPLDQNAVSEVAPGRAALSQETDGAHSADNISEAAGGLSSQTDGGHDSLPTSSGPLSDPVRAQIDDAIQQDRRFASMQPGEPIILSNM